MASDNRLQERAIRFQREHEIERQKQLGTYSSNENHSPHVNSSNNGLAPSDSWHSSSGPTYNMRRKFLKTNPSPQAPIYDLVQLHYFRAVAFTNSAPRMSLTGISTPLSASRKSFSNPICESPAYVLSAGQGPYF